MRMSIGRKVILVNIVLAFITLGVFLFSFIFFNYITAIQEKQYSNDILQSVSDSLTYETQRLRAFTSQISRDKSIVLAVSNKLGGARFLSDSMNASDKLTLAQGALPYAQTVALYCKSNQKVITLGNAVMNAADFEKQLRGNLPQSEFPSDLYELPNGFHSYRSYALYVTHVLDYGTLLIKLDPERFCDLKILSAVMPAYAVLVLDENGKLFVSSDEGLNGVLTQFDSFETGPWRLDCEGRPLEITKQDAAAGFSLLLVHQTNSIGKLQYTLNMLVIFAGLVIFATCMLTVLLNKQIYIPLRSVVRLLGDPMEEPLKQRNEIEAISRRLIALTRENSAMTEQIQGQQWLQVDIALHFVFSASEPPSAETTALLQAQYSQYWVAVAAMQDSKGGGAFEQLDHRMTAQLDSRVVSIDPFCHAYVIPAEKNIRTERESLMGILEEIKEENMMLVVGASDLYETIDFLQEAYRQAWNRMLSNPFSRSGDCLLCMADAVKENPLPRSISLEVQNTVAGCILNGTAAEIENILQNLLAPSSGTTLRDTISLYTAMCSLIHVVLSFSGLSVSQVELKTQRSQTAVYNPDYMYACVLEDCLQLNKACGGRNVLRYQVVEYLQDHYGEPLSLESIASNFGITPVYLSSYFKKNVGVNLSVYLSNIRIEKAKAILAETPSIKLAELASLVGIQSESTFSRQFRNYTGITPDQYRKMNPPT